MLFFIVVLAHPWMWIFKRSTNWTIYLLHNHLDIYLIIPWKRKTSLVLSNLKWFEKSKSRHWGKNWIKKNLRQPNNSVLCLKLKWPQHQRHLLLKRRTKPNQKIKFCSKNRNLRLWINNKKPENMYKTKDLGKFQVIFGFQSCSPVFCCLFTSLADVRKKWSNLEVGLSLG